MSMRQRAISLVAAVLMRTGSDEGVGEAASQSGEALAAALVGAGESLADWWLDHPEESAGAIAARLMNLVWMGFGNLVEGQVWRPPTRGAEPTGQVRLARPRVAQLEPLVVGGSAPPSPAAGSAA